MFYFKIAFELLANTITCAPTSVLRNAIILTPRFSHWTIRTIPHSWQNSLSQRGVKSTPRRKPVIATLNFIHLLPTVITLVTNCHYTCDFYYICDQLFLHFWLLLHLWPIVITLVTFITLVTSYYISAFNNPLFSFYIFEVQGVIDNCAKF